MKIRKGGYKFDYTGREFDSGIDGLFGLGGLNDITYGYDSYVYLIDKDGYEDSDMEFMPEEKKEIALFMIKRWADFGMIKIENI